jgi:putative membrane protein (TIGR04086 family)
VAYCSNCSAQLEEGAAFCVKCGHPVGAAAVGQASPDTAKGNAAARQQGGKRGLKLVPILVGTLVTVLLLLSFGYITRAVASSNINDATLMLIESVLGLICYIIGGLIAGAMAEYKGAVHGMLAAVIAVFLSMIVNYGMGNFKDVSAFLILFSLAFGLLIALGLGALGGYLGERLRNRKSIRGS